MTSECNNAFFLAPTGANLKWMFCFVAFAAFLNDMRLISIVKLRFGAFRGVSRIASAAYINGKSRVQMISVAFPE